MASGKTVDEAPGRMQTPKWTVFRRPGEGLVAYAVKVRLGRVVCRDRESLSEYDQFALMGAVIVDGTTTTFERAPIAVNERIAGSYSDSLVFSGSSSSRQIGLVLRGYDVDNNTKWKKNRAKVQEAMNTLADYVGYVPVVGEGAAAILKHWPKVVDAAVDLDKDDVLLSISTTVTLPEVSATLFKDSHHEIEVRFKRDDPTGYSDWDYSLSLLFTYSNLDVPSFGRSPKESIRPFKRSRAKDWIGAWESPNVSCEIANSPHGRELLDVTVKVRSLGRTSETESTAVPISKVFLERLAVELSKEKVPTTAGAGEAFTRTVVERASGNRSAVVSAVLSEPSIDMWSVAGRGASGAGRSRRSKSGVDISQRLEQIVAVPEREQSGADLLELGGDAVLEIYEVLHDGKRKAGHQLRYVHPVSSLTALAFGAVDEMLRRRVDVR